MHSMLISVWIITMSFIIKRALQSPAIKRKLSLTLLNSVLAKYILLEISFGNKSSKSSLETASL